DPVRTAAVLDAVLSDLQRVSPLVEPADDGYFFLDVRGLQAMYGDIAALEDAIRAAVPPLLRPRIGMANGQFAAAVAARRGRPGAGGGGMRGARQRDARVSGAAVGAAPADAGSGGAASAGAARTEHDRGPGAPAVQRGAGRAGAAGRPGLARGARQRYRAGG